MPVLTEPPSMGDVLKYEVNPNYTREVVTLLAGMPYPVGSVLGKITASGKFTLSPATGADGSQVATAVLLYAVDATLADAIGSFNPLWDSKDDPDACFWRAVPVARQILENEIAAANAVNRADDTVRQA